ncbi:unnamed protein product [Rotaria sordida]|uniref:Uncharacterized protein n=1 Tax=Rotaria sordida TaxID=392033 RepID=A0A818PFN6_9BILA|nr:unnamed protein product [Rotaria sordida]CAF3618339.1 unnamed protein product [Rotaria sordida]
MNLTMQQPISYPFYMDSSHLQFSFPWSSNPFQFPTNSQQYFPSSYQPPPPLPQPISYPLPFILSHQQHHNLPSKIPQSFSSYSNTRYNHLKQSTSHMNRHRSIDTSLYSQRYSISNHQYPTSKTKSETDYQSNSRNLLKAHSWHSMNHLNQSNLNINYGKDIPLIHDNHYYNSYLSKQNKQLHKRNLSSSPKQKQIPKQDIVRITTLDKVPIINNPIYQDDTIISTKNKNQSTQQPSPLLSSSSSSSSSSLSTCSSHSSLQKILNGSLRHDPLLNAAMEDFRQLRQTSSRSTSLTPHHRDLSRDSLCSNSTHHTLTPRSRNHSQSSFTSLERLEIRNLIKTLKTNGLQSLNIPIQLLTNSVQSTEIFLNKKSSSSSILTINKPDKSSVTEELEREFNKLRSNNPNLELIYVKPSLLKKDKKSNSSLSIDDKKQNETNDSSKLKQINENPILSNPISLNSPKISSEISSNEKNLLETKPEYAIPIKKISDVNLRSTKKDEQIRSFSFCKPINDIDNDIRQTRPLSMFSWLHCGLTNPFPTTFQPNKITNNNNNNNNNNEYDKSLVKENIYASDIDVHIPLPDEKDYLNNQTIMTDYLSDYKPTTNNNSSILNDLSRLFTRFGNNKHEHKSKLKRKLHKNNNNNNNNNNLRCSIM